MAFYDLSKEERKTLVKRIDNEIEGDLSKKGTTYILRYFSDEDTYIRKAAYQALGKLYISKTRLRMHFIDTLEKLAQEEDFRVRQTAINAAGEIGKHNFEVVVTFFDIGLFDAHHAVRNAVIGSIKKMGQKNPVPVLKWAKGYLKHPNKEIRREICHGIELRGRTHPEDILPLLEQLQFDNTLRVRNTLIHVLGQIAYKKGCLETVITALQRWKNEELVQAALDEIIDVHLRYQNFAHYSQNQASLIIDKHFGKTT